MAVQQRFVPIPLTTTFRRIRGVGALETEIRSRLDKLGTYSPQIMDARVLVEPVGRHHREGNRYHVRIQLMLPGEDVVIDHDASLRPTARARAAVAIRKQDEIDLLHRHAAVAIREAFEIARRRLQDLARRVRGSVKVHAPRPRRGAPHAVAVEVRRARPGWS